MRSARLAALLLLLVATTATAQREQVIVDTTSTQYQEHRGFVDSLVAGPVRSWVARLRFESWVIKIRADSLEEGIAARPVDLRFEYRVAVIVVDVPKLKASRNNLDELVVHELLHLKLTRVTVFLKLLTASSSLLQVLATLAEEELVTDLSRALTWR